MKKLNNRIEKIRSPIIVRISQNSNNAALQVFCPMSELKNIEGFGQLHNGKFYTEKGLLAKGSVNPMRTTRIVFTDVADLNDCLDSLSPIYNLIQGS